MITQTNLNSIYETSVRITEEPSCLLSKKLLKKAEIIRVFRRQKTRDPKPSNYSRISQL